MKQPTHSLVFTRKRKTLIVLPLLVIPFISLAFWALGGGKHNYRSVKQQSNPEGLNLQLPDATTSGDKAMNKLQYYDKAARDSAKHMEAVRNDPYYTVAPIPDKDSTAAYNIDSNEEKMYRKIAELDRLVNRRNTETIYPEDNSKGYPQETTDVDRLENMMNRIQSNGNTGDPEMERLDGMLDKIMQIQHPDREDKELQKKRVENDGGTYHVLSKPVQEHVSLLLNEQESRSALTADSNFYTVDVTYSNAVKPNAIEAVIHETRTVVNGSVIKLRLLQDIFINDATIPKGNFIYGKASLSGERLSIHIESLRNNNSLYPVSLAVYDMDGLAGVFIPGAITRDVAKESSDRAIQGIALGSLDPSLKAQATNAGIEAAKNLLTRKVKLVKVTIKAGYKILLKEK